MKTLLLLVVLAIAGAGCVGPMGAIGDLKASQLHELAKIKDANVTCVVANSPYGKGTALFLNYDKGVLPAGVVTIDDACKVTINVTPPPKP